MDIIKSFEHKEKANSIRISTFFKSNIYIIVNSYLGILNIDFIIQYQKIIQNTRYLIYSKQ